MNLSEIFNFESIKDATVLGLQKFFDFRGKKDRLSFIHFLIGMIVLVVLSNWFFNILGIWFIHSIITLASLIRIIPVMAAVSRRFNDKNRKAWPFIALFISITVISLLLQLVNLKLNLRTETFIEYSLFGLYLYSIAFPIYYGIMEK